jgi:hypothetical protein
VAGGPLADVLGYPLLSAIRERRSRRIARGVSVDAGALSHASTNAPRPLSPLEEAILIVATGITGVATMDGPLDIPGGGKELGTPYVHFAARAASSPDNSQPTQMFMTNDEGIYLLRRLHGREALALARDLPPRWDDWSEADWTAAAAAVTVKLHDGRLDFPREYPYYFAWNKQTSNRPGTTMFLPVTDVTRMYINGILNILAEPDGQRPFFVDDWQTFHPHGIEDWAAWGAEHLHLTATIPYQPIGGVERVRGGFVNRNNVVPLSIVRCMLADHEAYFLQQNLMLTAQAMGLGAWVHVGPQEPYLLQRDEAKGLRGLGFRFETPNRSWSRWPPVPATQPNPVGIDGILEGFCPPYITSMDEAVDRHLALKYESYADVQVFGRGYRDPASSVAQFQADAVRYSPDAIAYTKDICNYIVDTYGRFPAHVDAWLVPGTWVQVCHVELEYYEKFFAPGQYRRQAEHARIFGE